MNQDLYPSIYIPHGGGPCFFMDWTRGPANTWDNMAQWLGLLHLSLPQKPSAIVIFSAHWEAEVVRINSHPAPELIYDYYGFPEHTYRLSYPAPGSPELAKRIQTLFTAANISSELDPTHGFDHGTFVPLKVMFPEADIPVVQVSLHASLDPQLHLKMGAALQTLREDNILILGSGMSFHNMQILMQGSDPQNHSGQFDSWLNQACTATPKETNQQLSEWQTAPSALACHPREEHLIPLMVAAGAAGNDAGKNIFTDQVMGATVSAYQFG
ncbi:MAG: aromatic ring-opening dioxygenase catalytic subunit (LigB family) [Cycloclasticus sp.]|jgi:aromatic ring-opening dioxygenase catalytic subunit (LigB family)